MISFKEIGHLGRLGNQLFQFSSTLGIARMRGTNPIFPIDNTQTKKGTGPIDSATGKPLETKLDILSCFNINPDFFTELSFIKTFQRYNEIDFKYNPGVENIPDNTDLFGYFQTEKYFKDYEKELRENFIFRENHISYVDKYLEKIGKNIGERSKVSIHIRRGDYLYLSDHHPICSLEYYNTAIGLFDEGCIFLVFSDDIKWAKQNLIGERFLFIEIGDPFKELCLMSKCDHHIIANSSFSWWGSWINPNKNKKVIAPSKWFGESMKKDTSDIYCEGWIKI